MTGTEKIVSAVAARLCGRGYRVFRESVKQFRGERAAVVAVCRETAKPEGPRLVRRAITLMVTGVDGDRMTNEEFYRFSAEMRQSFARPVAFEGRQILPSGVELRAENGRGVCVFTLEFSDDAGTGEERGDMEELVMKKD